MQFNPGNWGSKSSLTPLALWQWIFTPSLFLVRTILFPLSIAIVGQQHEYLVGSHNRKWQYSQWGWRDWTFGNISVSLAKDWLLQALGCALFILSGTTSTKVAGCSCQHLNREAPWREAHRLTDLRMLLVGESFKFNGESHATESLSSSWSLAFTRNSTLGN